MRPKILGGWIPPSAASPRARSKQFAKEPRPRHLGGKVCSFALSASLALLHGTNTPPKNLTLGAPSGTTRQPPAMKSYMQQVLAVGVLLTGAEANLLSWPRDAVSWFPPRETGAVEKRAGSAAQPAPTSPANLHGDVLAKGYANGLALAKRSDDVCGYVSADPTWTFGCKDSFCFEAVNKVSSYSMVDCCGGDLDLCTAATTCLDSTDSSLAGSTSAVRTYICSDAEYPMCVTYLYGDGSLSGYTYLNCGKTAAVRTVFKTATGDVTSTTESTDSSSTTADSTSTTSSATSSSTTSSNPDSDSGGSGTNVGAIVGGVIGGVGLLALIGGLIAFFIIRSKRNNRNNQNNSPPQGPPQMAATVSPSNGGPGGPGGPPPPQMVYGGPPPGPNDPHASMLKPGYYGGAPMPQDPHMSYVSTEQQSSYMGSPPSSPHPPQGGSPMQQYNNGYQQQYGAVPPQQAGTPPVPFQPVGGYGNPQQTPPPMQQQQYGAPPPQQGQPVHYAELSSGRGDGELRELA